MKIFLINTGKTNLNYLKEGISVYEKRIRRYIPFEIYDIREPKKSKGLPADKIKENEGKNIIKYIDKSDYSVLLDKNGKDFDSFEFAGYIQRLMNQGLSNIYFFTGGDAGFSDEVYTKTSDIVSLSKMTFPHQLVRLIFAEQLFRALTILKGEPYHH